LLERGKEERREKDSREMRMEKDSRETRMEKIRGKGEGMKR